MVNYGFFKLTSNSVMFHIAIAIYHTWMAVYSEHTKYVRFTVSVLVAAILDETVTSKFIARLIANQVLLWNFTSQNDCFTITSMTKCTIKYVTLQQFSFLQKITSNCKCFSFEIMSSARGAETSTKNRRDCAWVKPPTAARQVTWNITAHPGAHQKSYRS